MPIVTRPKAHALSFVGAAILALMDARVAQARIVLSQAVLDITPNSATARDIEVWNDGTSVSYVVAQPFEVISPGLPGEKREPVLDPSVGGLLVTPQKLILQPDEKKLVRIAAVMPPGQTDRVWRVTIKPVAGPVTASETALKLLIGYDVLVIARPEALTSRLVGARSGSNLTLRNSGNTNVEVYQGKLCPAPGGQCTDLPSKRIYPSESWTQALPSTGTITYRVLTAGRSQVQEF